MVRVCLAYGLLGVALWPVPLLNVLQVESAAAVAVVAFFVAGWTATRRFRSGEASVLSVLAWQEAALLIPLGLLLIAQLWAPNCTIGQGLLFYALFPGITVVFAVAFAYCVTGTGTSHPFLVLAVGGVLVGLAGPLYDLGFHPQFYTYNHVFGGVLGPIYDEQLALRKGLFAFRGLTLLWAGGAVAAGRLLRGRSGTGALVLCGAGIVGGYLFAAPLGLNTTETHLQEALGGHVRTAHFDLYYDPEHLDRPAVKALADDHEAHYRRLEERLDLAAGEAPDRIQSYLYPHPDAKARLTGARYTSVSPVWLGTPQVHLLVDRAETSLGHELAHVFSRPYGLPGLNASWAPGLVEGWAVALEPPAPGPSPHDLVQAAAGSGATAALSLKADALADRLTPWGFWTGRGAVSYATMGSFVRFLLTTYGPAPLKQVYARGDFAAVYGRSLTALVREWTAFLENRPLVDRSAHALVTRRFTQPSLFETACPHYVPPHRRHLQEARRAQRGGDPNAATRHLRQAVEAAPQSTAAHAAFARRRLAEGRTGAVDRQLDTLATRRWTPALWRLEGDVRALRGNPSGARAAYRAALDSVPQSVPSARVRLMLRTAVADRPRLVRVLVNGEPAAQQARALRALDLSRNDPGRAWRALRLQDAHRYDAAARAWTQVQFGPAAGWPHAWRATYTIQRAAWRGEAAVRAGRAGAASVVRAAARRAESHGAAGWAEALRGWARRAETPAVRPSVRN